MDGEWIFDLGVLSSKLYTTLHCFGLSIYETVIRVWMKIINGMEIQDKILERLCVIIPLIF